MLSKKSPLIMAVVTAIAAVQTPVAVSQESSFAIEEVVVTARKRSENLQEVPIAISAIDAATIGDGANDLAMLQASGMGVAFEGKPLLLTEVAIQLNHTDLRGLLYLQGYKEHDFIVDKI